MQVSKVFQGHLNEGVFNTVSEKTFVNVLRALQISKGLVACLIVQYVGKICQMSKGRDFYCLLPQPIASFELELVKLRVTVEIRTLKGEIQMPPDYRMRVWTRKLKKKKTVILKYGAVVTGCSGVCVNGVADWSCDNISWWTKRWLKTKKPALPVHKQSQML